MNISFNNINFYGKISKQSKPSAYVIRENLKGSLNSFDNSIVSEIKDLFELAHSSIKAVAKSCNTRSSIKNGYSSLKKGVAGSRILEFSKIGEKGEDISINVRIDRGSKSKTTKKAIIIIDDTQLVINPKGQIEKNPSMRFIRDNSGRGKGEVVQYYTQEEIDRLNPARYFYVLKKELNKYIEYINSRCKEINAIRELKAKNTEGNVKKYLGLIEEVNKEFQYFKTHINKLSEKSLDKDVFRIVNKIKTFTSQNSIMFKNALSDGRSLYLLYSKINKKPAMKILLMDYSNKNVDESFVIYNNKLAKFKPKKPNSKPSHLDYDFHYYTQEEIDKSGLKHYLTLTLQKLQSVNENLANGIKERHER